MSTHSTPHTNTKRADHPQYPRRGRWPRDTNRQPQASAAEADSRRYLWSTPQREPGRAPEQRAQPSTCTCHAHGSTTLTKSEQREAATNRHPHDGHWRKPETHETMVRSSVAAEPGRPPLSSAPTGPVAACISAGAKPLDVRVLKGSSNGLSRLEDLAHARTLDSAGPHPSLLGAKRWPRRRRRNGRRLPLHWPRRLLRGV